MNEKAPPAESGGETAVVFDVEHCAFGDGPGIRTVVFVKGCPLRCRWCHNPESWTFEPQEWTDGEICGRERTAKDVAEEVLRDKPFYEASGGGLTISGGEPLASARFSAALLEIVKSEGVHTAVETSLAAPAEALESIAPFTDLWLADINLKIAVEIKGGRLAPEAERVLALCAV